MTKSSVVYLNISIMYKLGPRIYVAGIIRVRTTRKTGMLSENQNRYSELLGQFRGHISNVELGSILYLSLS